MKLFRNLRRKLITLSKIKSYMLYALGEVILITIGISIAWKINSLNDIRKDAIVENKIYVNLNEELRTNLHLLNVALIEYPQTITNLENVLNYVGEKPSELTQEAKDSILNLSDKEVDLLDSTVNSIVCTSKFEFLENTNLKDLIILYPTKIKDFKEQNEKLNGIINNRIKPVLENYISLSEKLRSGDPKYERIKKFGSASDYSGLLADKEYQNSIIDRMLQTRIQLNNAKNLLSKTKVLIAKLNEELD